MYIIPQVDYKSYLLDFKSLPLKEEDGEDSGAPPGSLESNNCKKELVDAAEESSPTAVTPVSTRNETTGSNLMATGGHHTMEFFEMCAALITQLAR